jgi:hypothetical protein
MVATINIQPNLTTNAAGSFPNPSTGGVIQGTAYGDPAVRYQLAGGILASTETLPMWGGVAITEYISQPVSAGGPFNTALGNSIIRATTVAAITGFSVFDQNYSAITTPTSEVGLVGSGGMVNFYRYGSNARIAVACDPTLVDLETGVINPNVSWDLVNQLLVPYVGTLTISSGTYNNTTGVVTLTMSAPIAFGPGDSIIVSALTGTGSYAGLDGTFTALAGTTGSTVVYNAGAGVGASTITGGSLTLGSGASHALNARVLEVISSNNMTVTYNATTGNASWNRNSCAAIILI